MTKMTSLSRFVRTVIHLQPTQVVHQLKLRLWHPKFDHYDFTGEAGAKMDEPIWKPTCQSGNTFRFLNIEAQLSDWNFMDHGMLWAYNLNYMDYLLQKNADVEESIQWIDRFINDLPGNKVGLDPYPIALRGMNWLKFFCLHPEARSEKRISMLYSLFRLLEKKLEYHLLGNHLLEDFYSLFMAAIFFHSKRMYDKYSHLLCKELRKQILPDGAHYEQSPMYHCILLDRLLDCYNLSVSNLFFPNQELLNDFLRNMAERMLGHLKSIVYADGSIPLLNDAAQGIAPTSQELFSYAYRLGLKVKPVPLKESGYRKMATGTMEAIVDVGNIKATYQPGHTHADTFSYELRIGEKPFIVDTGISTYNKTARRQYERSTAAHNTVTVDGQDSSEVWGGFRVGRRAVVQLINDSYNIVEAIHDGYGKKGLHKRIFKFVDQQFCIEDAVEANGECINFIHLAPDVQIVACDDHRIMLNNGYSIETKGCCKVEILQQQVSFAYNSCQNTVVLALHFRNQMSYHFLRT